MDVTVQSCMRDQCSAAAVIPFTPHLALDMPLSNTPQGQLFAALTSFHPLHDQ
jgi:hypothetical protein